MEKKLKFPNMSKEELSQLAKDIAMDKVFCSCFMSDHELNNIGMVFMPLALGALADMPKEMVDDIGFVYEYYTEARTGRCINGMPIFFSCRMVSKADARRIGEKVKEIKKVMESI